MQCSKFYLPIPPRAWSRVDNKCTFETSKNYNKMVNRDFILSTCLIICCN